MTGADWAYVPSVPPAATLLDEIATAPSHDARTDLLLTLGAFVHSLDDRACFGATADNVVRNGGALSLARSLLDDVAPLDRDASHARIAWHLAWSLVQIGALGAEAPDSTVDELAATIGNQAGLNVTLIEIDRFRRHEADRHAATRGFDAHLLERDMRAVGTLTPRRVAAGEMLDARASSTALVRAYDDLVAARRDRDAAEAAAVDAAASRALAQSLGEVLERDEWIRARLRAVKATKPARALIEARKRLLGRDEG
jgi:hypothetical protein